MIRFRTLGGLELSDSQGRDLHGLLSKPKRLALLAYLASHNHHASRRRDSVVALFWPDMDAAHEGNLAQAVEAARQGVALDPDDEKGLARLIALLDRSGDRAGALSTFETFRRRLEKEYDATPSPETAARIQAIRTRHVPFVD